MAVTYGFYNSVNKDRAYNAIQMSQIFDGIINDGIYMSVLDHFAVTASGGMNISVGGGRAWFNHTWTYNDSSMLITIDESEFEANRIDAVVLKVDRRDSARKNDIVVIKGTPADVPEKPVIEDGNDIYYHPLAYITINAAVTVITDANIENAIGVDPRTPFVTGIIEHIHAEDLINQWQTEWDEWNQEHRDAYIDWVNQQETDMETWISTQESDMENWEAVQKESFLEWMADEKSGYSEWLRTTKEEFDEWFENLHYILDGDVAAHLQNEIDDINSDMVSFKEEVQSDIDNFEEEIKEQEFKRYYNLCTNNTTYVKDNDGNIIGWSSQGEGVTLNVTITETNTTKQIVSIINDGNYIWTKTNVMDYDTYTLSESYTKEAIDE